VMDYIFRWLAWKFLPRDAQPRENASIETMNGKETSQAADLAQQFSRAVTGPSAAAGAGQPGLAGVHSTEDDAPVCADCGAIMVRNGSCYRCMNCGSTSGCS
jgi:ribonucleoside-diphosphate reductase alpha chain